MGEDVGWWVEQRYRAVLEVRAGSPVAEVADRYGVSRQAVYRWRRRFDEAGVVGLADRSRRPRSSPSRTTATLEAEIAGLRREHPRWGARRIAYELAVTHGAEAAPSRATVHRVLVRHELVAPQEQRRPRTYKRWARETPMALWQLDLVGGVHLAGGREVTMVSGIDNHSRSVVVAALVVVPTGRAVTGAFLAAIARSGVPSEVLTDNGKQFTGRYTRPAPVEVLFERTCRELGITARLTKRRSPDEHRGRSSGSIGRCAVSCSTRSRRSPISTPPRPRSMPGYRATTTSDRIRAWTWPPRPGCSAPDRRPPPVRSPAPHPRPRRLSTPRRSSATGCAPRPARSRRRVRQR
ncbi:helix-turn-helix domain-containing protein [Actinomycetospora endophytica]|uniref:Helix-turn-helix domain-containing protein n=1 Tax=Actinomycetospora endophytica TaxID=2291215 RepID=A0ABS8P626_9PSEU|nr:helix-turn-helix domain-containing protein [Actinomycetospora endophytica]MCD2193686.1 helix-turn-helix domain-containing protein [Actinomycetospora endophytica]